MRLVILNDNAPGEGFINDWGWSVLVEGRGRFLFDADTKEEVLLHNAEVLGVPLTNLDFAVLSHWHYDHYGGFPLIGRLNPGLDLYAPPAESVPGWGLNVISAGGAGELFPGVWTSGVIGFEQAVGVETPSGLAVIVGCSHPGVDMLTKEVLEVSGYEKAHLVIGGFHYPSKASLDRLAHLTEIIAPAHCSGGETKAYVRREYPEKFLAASTGSVIEL
jgi:7,8-dihydropterin-6-yl-methyl-4-(beta-D-ribofuranosyl)aminobenzene 5'-phosphate synthase